MNKKILFLILLAAIVLPMTFAHATASTTLTGMAQSVENAAIAIATPIVVIGWIIAGILYLTAAGAPEKINTAKSAMIACVIGTVLVVLAIGSGMIISIIKSALGIS